MGTDIHAYVAVRNPGSGEFKTCNVYSKYGNKYVLSECYNGRDYELFDALSNVRGYGYDAIAPNRGLSDAPQEILDERDKFKTGPDITGFEDSAYGDSWVGLDELYAALRDKKRYPKKDEYGDRGPRTGIKMLYNGAKAFADLGCYSSLADVRVYFWFDC